MERSGGTPSVRSSFLIRDNAAVTRYSDKPPREPIRAERLRHGRRTAARSLKSGFGWVFVPFIALFCLTIVVVSLPSTWAVATGGGTPGTFTAVRQECSPRRICSWYGTYASDDGRVQLPEVIFDDDPEGWAPGSTATVVYAGGTDPAAVYSAGERFSVAAVLGFGALSLLSLAAWATALVYAVRRLPQPRWIRWLQGLAQWR